MQAGRTQLQRSQRPSAVQQPCQTRAAVLRAGAAARRRAVPCRASQQPADRFPAQVCVVLGTQWGDEGKGKLVDILAQQYDVVARAQVGRSGESRRRAARVRAVAVRAAAPASIAAAASFRRA